MKNKISIVIFICILFQSVNVNAQPLNSINVVGMSFNYDGLFNNSDTEFSGLLAPLNQDQRGSYRNLDSSDSDSGWWATAVAVVVVVAALAIVLDDDDAAIAIDDD